MDSGIFYTTKEGKQVDLFKLTYNKDNTALFDVEVLPDNTDYSEEVLFDYLNVRNLFSVVTRQDVSYKNRKNVDMLLHTFATQYSSQRYGIKPVGNPNEDN